MVIKVRRISCKGRGDMTLEEFKRWLRKYDANKDGRISKEELQNAVQAAHGGLFSGWKSKHGVQYADTDGNGFIDDDEVIYLRAFANKHLGIQVVDF